jgi:hypothetical protein
VANSGSTSFIVYIPEWFNPNDVQILEALDKAKPWVDDVNIQTHKLREAVDRILGELRQGGTIWLYEKGVEHEAAFHAIFYLIKDKFVLHKIRDYEDSNILIGVTKEKLVNAFLNAELFDERGCFCVEKKDLHSLNS